MPDDNPIAVSAELIAVPADEPTRRSSDARIDCLAESVEQLKKEMRLNTEITQQVRDVMTSFRILAAVAKWLTVVIGGAAAIVGLGDAWDRIQ